jgi:hypothetical protein
MSSRFKRKKKGCCAMRMMMPRVMTSSNWYRTPMALHAIPWGGTDRPVVDGGGVKLNEQSVAKLGVQGLLADASTAHGRHHLIITRILTDEEDDAQEGVQDRLKNEDLLPQDGHVVIP